MFYRDFNLEKKIEALPSLSLEEFQEKKKQQRTKKKKILLKGNSNSSNKKNFDNLPSGNDSSNQNNQKHLRPSDELLKEEEKNLVGSQKRKARKQNITRNAALTTLSKQNNDQDPSKCESLLKRITKCLFLKCKLHFLFIIYFIIFNYKFFLILKNYF